MAIGYLYIIPEDHEDEGHQLRKALLGTMARAGAIVQFLESVLVNDRSGAANNLYGIEDEAAIRRANVILNHSNNCRVLMSRIKETRTVPDMTKERERMLDEVNKLPRPKARVSEDLRRFVLNFPMIREREIEDKYFYFKRNHWMAQNIRNLLGILLNDENKPKVFALSVGAGHVDGSGLTVPNKYANRQDLKTLLGSSISIGNHTIHVIYGDTSTVVIANRALTMCGDLPFMKMIPARAWLEIFINTGISM